MGHNTASALPPTRVLLSVSAMVATSILDAGLYGFAFNKNQNQEIGFEVRRTPDTASPILGGVACTYMIRNDSLTAMLLGL